MANSEVISIGDVATWVAVAVAIALGGFSVWQHYRSEALRRSRDYLDAAVRWLEQAYRELEARRSNAWSGLPEPDRLLWLSVARMIREAESTSTKIQEESHRVLYRQARTYWRGKLYDLLAPLTKVPLTYFADSPDKALIQFSGDRAPISPKSLRVIRDFTSWPQGEPDPLAGVGNFDSQEIDHMQSFGWRSAGMYLEALDVMHGDSDSRKEYWRKQWNKPVE